MKTGLTQIAIVLATIWSILPLNAQDHALVVGGESPNKQFRVEIAKPTEEGERATISVCSVKDGKPIGDSVDGYACFERAKDPNDTFALWSPDSQFVAIKWCKGKRDRDVILAQVTGDRAKWITQEDYMASILHELKADEINRFVNNTPSRWISPNELVIDVLGDCIVGDRATAPWKIFHYEVCVNALTGKIKRMKQIELKDEEG